VVPGGGWNDRAPRGAWAEAERGELPAAIAAAHRAGAQVATVCTGAMLATAAGLTQGRPAITHHSAVDDLRASGARVSVAHLRHLNPFPANLGEVLGNYDKVLIPEMNLGQLRMLVRARYLVDAVGYNKVRGLPFKAEELADAIIGLLDEGAHK